MSTPQVSVVIPTRNRRRLLARTLATVLRQGGVDIEVFVIDEASADGTADYLAGLAEDRLTVIHHSAPRGQSAARNEGIARARGDWVAFCDDDDLWAPNKLARQVAAAGAEHGWVMTGDVVVDERLHVLAGTRPPTDVEMGQIFSYNPVPSGASAVLVRSDLVRAVGGFDAELSFVSDWDLWLRLWLAAPWTAVDHPLVAYLRHRHSVSHRDYSEAELSHMRSKHADALTGFGKADATEWLHWNAVMDLQSGRRWRAARRMVGLARHHRDRRHLLRAAVAAIAPATLQRRWDRNTLSTLPAWWVREAEAWLAPLRSASVPGRRG